MSRKPKTDIKLSDSDLLQAELVYWRALAIIAAETSGKAVQAHIGTAWKRNAFGRPAFDDDGEYLQTVKTAQEAGKRLGWVS